MGRTPCADQIPLLDFDRSRSTTPALGEPAVFVAPNSDRRSSAVVDEAEAGLLANDYNATGKDVDEGHGLTPLPVTVRLPRKRWLTSLRLLLLVGTGILGLCFLSITPKYGVRSAWRYLEPAGPTRPPAERFFDPPSRRLRPDKIWVQEAADGDDYTITAIVLHGLGDRGDGVPFVWDMPLDFPYIRWVAPTADVMNVTVRDKKPNTAWFDMHSFPDVYHLEDVEGYVHSQQQLNRLIDDERARMVALGKEPRIVLMGFSQGETGLTRDGVRRHAD